MAIIRQTNKKTGITYVIESESYWDKEKKHSEPAVKETSQPPATLPVEASDLNEEIRLRDARILELEQQVARLQEDKEAILRELALLSAKFST